ncbi:nucleolar protein 6 [[Candida] railenensis]|uniref:Nucleolar protein 6 n=1 Tax=[Candida] railenensis TaxID=45579 RepID=A0A9P0QSL7_9ASCO|nr:nucleolar protein 6 [[Candida] railenensis]
MAEEKLTKKQRKALEFRKSKEETEALKKEKEETKKVRKEEKRDDKKDEKKDSKKRKIEEVSSSVDAPETAAEGSEDAPKKRKTRRGKKGKGVNGGKGPRFILFVGNLPYDITQEEILGHFKSSKPDRVRIRQDKGIAFLEFDNDTQEIQSKMELALRLHHSTLKFRKINVELTVGGGGNSENRKTKLKDKNEKLLEERRTRIKEESIKNRKKENNSGSIHPSRAALIN